MFVNIRKLRRLHCSRDLNTLRRVMLVLLVNIVPTLIVLLIERGRSVKSDLLRIALAWFIGQAAFTMTVYLAALLLKLFTAGVLWKAALLVLSLGAGLAAVFAFRARAELRPLLHRAWVFPRLSTLVIVACCALFSFFFFGCQLAQREGAIWMRAVYWDFPAQAALIQSFAAGDNFPARIEFFAGAPLLYHFFSPLLTAIYAALGLDLVAAVNLYSSVAFAALLVAVVGLCEEFFASRLAGCIACLLTVTSSSLYVLDYFWRKRDLSLAQLLAGIVDNPERPDLLALRPAEIAYNGNMFNMFYFVEERQLIAGGLFLVLGLAVLHHRRRCSPAGCLLAGSLLGLFAQWHFYASLAFLAGLGFLLVCDRWRSRTLALLAGFGPVFLAYAWLLRSVAADPVFLPDARHPPVFNPNFSNFSGGSFWPSHAVLSYTYAYGAKIVVVICAFCLLRVRRLNAELMLLLAAIVPAFILTNTLQLSPKTIFENHKWLRLLNIFIDVAAAFGLAALWKAGKWEKLLFVPLLAGLMASGLIELAPYLAAPPATRLASYPSAFAEAVRRNSERDAVFLTRHVFEIGLAGRATYLDNPKNWPGNVMYYAHFVDRAPRLAARRAIYRAASRAAFCEAVQSAGIDYVEFAESDQRRPVFAMLSGFPLWTARSEAGKELTFVAAGQGCAAESLLPH